jgi:hypothetical protein
MTHHHRPPSPRGTRRRRIGLAAASAFVATAAVTGIVMASQDDDPTDASGAVGETVLTGEVNAMGMPVIETPGSGTNPISVGAVVVDHGTWELGTVPLNTAVRPEWHLRNTGDEAVVIGEPRPEVRQGCCPGLIALSTRTIPPGGEATLAFELSMHPGMDGWHDIAIHVPISAGPDDQILTLDVTGDFRDT